MASIRINGVKHQSGAGAHPTKDKQGRAKTRGAQKDIAMKEATGKTFRLGAKIKSFEDSE